MPSRSEPSGSICSTWPESATAWRRSWTGRPRPDPGRERPSRRFREIPVDFRAAEQYNQQARKLRHPKRFFDSQTGFVRREAAVRFRFLVHGFRPRFDSAVRFRVRVFVRGPRSSFRSRFVFDEPGFESAVRLGPLFAHWYSASDRFRCRLAPERGFESQTEDLLAPPPRSGHVRLPRPLVAPLRRVLRARRPSGKPTSQLRIPPGDPADLQHPAVRRQDRLQMIVPVGGKRSVRSLGTRAARSESVRHRKSGERHATTSKNPRRTAPHAGARAAVRG